MKNLSLISVLIFALLLYNREAFAQQRLKPEFATLYAVNSAKPLYVPPGPPPVFWKTTAVPFTWVYDTSFTAAEKIAIEYAINQWGRALTSSVPIQVKVSKTYSTSPILAQGRPASIVPNFGSIFPSYYSDTWYPLPLAIRLAQMDLDTGSDIEIFINQRFLTNGFYLGTDGNVPAGKWDLVTAVMHEIAHGLGFQSSVRWNSISGKPVYRYISSSTASSYPLIFDRFLKGPPSIGVPSVMLTTLSDTAPQLSYFATSNNVFWDGWNGRVANNGSNPKIFAPSPFMAGSTMNHLDTSISDTELMRQGQATQLAVHNVGAITAGMLNDIGWQAVVPPVGIEDGIVIKGYANNNITPQAPKNFTPGSQYGFYMEFQDENPKGDYPVSMTWELSIFYNGGKYVLNQHSGSYGGVGLWQPVVGAVPASGYQWLRNENGTIRGQLLATCTDNDGTVHKEAFDISVNYKPDVPEFTYQNISDFGRCDKMRMSYYARGATIYKVFYEENIPGVLGPKVPMDTIAKNTVELDRMMETISYTFTVRASNPFGTTIVTYTRPRCKYGIKVYPNPALEATMLEMMVTDFFIKKVEIVKIDNPNIGRLYQFEGNANQVKITLENLPVGNYSVKVESTEGEVDYTTLQHTTD